MKIGGRMVSFFCELQGFSDADFFLSSEISYFYCEKDECADFLGA